MEVYLVRHGESEGNRSKTLQGCMNFDLTDKGRSQAAKLGGFWAGRHKLDRLFSSDLVRAHETAKAIGAEQNLTVQTKELFREINLGPMEGKTREKIYKEFPEVKEKDLLCSGLDGAESVEDITKRCKDLKTMLLAADFNKAAIVSHGGFITIFLMYLILGDEWHRVKRPFLMDNTGVTKVVRRENSLHVAYLNNRPHLL